MLLSGQGVRHDARAPSPPRPGLGRHAVVSRSSTLARGHAFELAASQARATGRALVVLDTPAVHHHLRARLTVPGLPAWRLLGPGEPARSVGLALDECLLVANYAVGCAQGVAGPALLELVHLVETALVTLRPRDLARDRTIRDALGDGVIDLTVDGYQRRSAPAAEPAHGASGSRFGVGRR